MSFSSLSSNPGLTDTPTTTHADTFPDAMMPQTPASASGSYDGNHIGIHDGGADTHHPGGDNITYKRGARAARRAGLPNGSHDHYPPTPRAAAASTTTTTTPRTPGTPDARITGLDVANDPILNRLAQQQQSHSQSQQPDSQSHPAQAQGHTRPRHAQGGSHATATASTPTPASTTPTSPGSATFAAAPRISPVKGRRPSTTQSVATVSSSHSATNDASSNGRTPFRARPAPPSTNVEGVGPRLTKSAALRQGLEWFDPRDARRAAGEDVPVDFDNTPGHKRSGLRLAVPSLASPSMAPRANRAALLRLGVDTKTPTRTAEEMNAAALRNKAREAAERLERRKSIQPPASIVVEPELVPRQNRAALLRAGYIVDEPRRDPKDMAEAAARNKARDAAERAERRKSVQLPASLAAPAITPRSNRSSVLRAGGGNDALPSTRPAPSKRHSMSLLSAPRESLANGTATPAATKSARRASTMNLKAPFGTATPSKANPAPSSTSKASNSRTARPTNGTPGTSNGPSNGASSPEKRGLFGKFLGPKPTKSSLLREGLGAKVKK